MTIDFAFSPKDKVKIIPLDNILGEISECMWNGITQSFYVRYFFNGDLKTCWINQEDLILK